MKKSDNFADKHRKGDHSDYWHRSPFNCIAIAVISLPAQILGAPLLQDQFMGYRFL